MTAASIKPDSSRIELQSPRINLVIALPGTSYQSTRFDWSSFAISLILDGKHQFASSELAPDNPSFKRGGQGLSCEFGIRDPIGYRDCPVGEWFPKLGVGLIRRETTADYDFFHHYAEIRPLQYQIDCHLPADVSADSQAVTITGTCAPHRGYAWTMSRTWIVSGTTIHNRCTIHNTGDKPLETTEYCHNFIRLGDAETGPDTKLEFGFPIASQAPDYFDPSNCLKGQTPVFIAKPAGEFYLGRLSEVPVERAWWRASNSANKLSFREELSQTCINCSLWGKASVISPELFTQILVRPGETIAWTRQFQLAAG